jgi:hypothetical protein
MDLYMYMYVDSDVRSEQEYYLDGFEHRVQETLAEELTG